MTKNNNSLVTLSKSMQDLEIYSSKEKHDVAVNTEEINDDGFKISHFDELENVFYNSDLTIKTGK